jgi:protein-S-isoprenylcysteine O-methyltransferase Ste14
MKRILVNLMASTAVLLACLLCLRLDAFLPFTLPAVPEPIDWVFLIGGFSLIAMAEIAFLIRGGASGAPADPTRRLVITGIYRWVRNPIYLGGALILLGVSLSRRSPTLFLAACLFLPVMHFTAVYREEQRLERDFNGDYLEYKHRVPRWIPRPPKYY